jgi:enamine deaminase RidA (YjgF/YER057c/UK114 family)
MKKWLLLLAVAPVVAHAAIGSISEHKGSASIVRGKQELTVANNTGVESDDTVKVASNSETHITFRDNTKVTIKANSRLVIDDFVFDPKKSDAGKMSMHVALGTVAYTSGQIAKTNKQNTNIRTPTAQVAVRGTDFSMTVDESGQSLVVLLPSCDDPKKLNNYQMGMGNCVVGQIDVETDAGIVTLNQPYTATLVTSSNQAPLAPVKIDPTQNISNVMILSVPQPVAGADKERKEKAAAEKDRSSLTDEEQLKTHKSSAAVTTVSSTSLIGANAGNVGGTGSPETNPCWPFNECGNEKQRNWYHRIDPDRGNVIFIRADERTDNTTYSISVNSNDVDTKVVGDGSNKVTVRQWNR